MKNSLLKGILGFCLICCFKVIDAQTREEFLKNIESKVNQAKYIDADVIADLFLKNFPDDTEAVLTKSKVVDLRGNREEAIGYAYAACEKFPASKTAFMYTAVLCSHSGLFDTSLSFLNKILTFNINTDDSTDVYINIALNYFYKENFDTAVHMLNKLIAHNPNCIGCYSNLAMLYSRLNEKKKSLELMKKTYQLDSSSAFICNNIGLALSESEEYAEAIQYFNKGIQIDKAFAFCYSNRGYCHLKLGMHSLALKDINQSIALNNTNAYAYRNRALVYLDLKLKSEACKDLLASKELGFKEYYGNEVNELIEKNCGTK